MNNKVHKIFLSGNAKLLKVQIYFSRCGAEEKFWGENWRQQMAFKIKARNCGTLPFALIKSEIVEIPLHFHKRIIQDSLLSLYRFALCSALKFSNDFNVFSLRSQLASD